MLHKAYIRWLWICQCYSRNSSIFCSGTLIIDVSLICKNRYMVWTHITFMNPERFQPRFLVHQPDTIKPRWPHHDLSLGQGCLIVTAWSQTSSWPESQAGLPYCDSMIPNLIMTRVSGRAALLWQHDPKPHHDLSLRQGCLIVTAWSQTSSATCTPDWYSMCPVWPRL
jgi:hypothetical protein